MGVDDIVEHDEEDRLLLELDALVFGDDARLMGAGVPERIKRAREWLEVLVDRNREKLCMAVSDSTGQPSALFDAALAAGAITDALTSLGLAPPTAFTAAAVLAKWGATVICGGDVSSV